MVDPLFIVQASSTDTVALTEVEAEISAAEASG